MTASEKPELAVNRGEQTVADARQEVNSLVAHSRKARNWSPSGRKRS